MWINDAKKMKVNPDINYYFEASIVKPMTRLLEHVVDQKTLKDLFDRNRYDKAVEVHANKYNVVGYFSKSGVINKTVKKNAGKLKVQKKNNKRGPPQITSFFVPKKQKTNE
jgi:hypothetical protein